MVYKLNKGIRNGISSIFAYGCGNARKRNVCVYKSFNAIRAVTHSDETDQKYLWTTMFDKCLNFKLEDQRLHHASALPFLPAQTKHPPSNLITPKPNISTVNCESASIFIPFLGLFFLLLLFLFEYKSALNLQLTCKTVRSWHMAWFVSGRSGGLDSKYSK